MSLKAFHFFFIIVSILLSAYFGAWCIQNYSDTQSGNVLLMGIGSFSSTVILVVYLGWFLKKSKGLGFLGLAFSALIATSLAPKSALACAVCIGNPNSPLVKSASDGVFFLMVIITGVLLAIGGILLFWARRARQYNLTHG